MGFQQGLSGLNVSSKNLDVIGHNIANANTTGFKASRAEFADLMASSMGAAGGSSYGIGVEVAAVAQQFSQGNVTVTGNNLDVAINGNGFFKVKQPDESFAYTRAGNFKLDKAGDLVTTGGAQVMGFKVDSTTGLSTSEAQALSFPTGAPIQAKATSSITAVLNLDARVKAPTPVPAVATSSIKASGNLNATATDAAAAVPPTPRNTYSTSVTVFDPQGTVIPVNLYFEKTSNPGEWNVFDSLTSTTSVGTVTFDSTTGNIATGGNIPLTLTAANALTFPVTADLSAMTQLGNTFSVTSSRVGGSAETIELAAPRSTYGTSLNVFDSQGVATPVNLYFSKTNTNQWAVYDSLSPTATSVGTLEFDNAGVLISGQDINLRVHPDPANPNALPPFDVKLDLSAATQFGSKFAVADLKQDGYASGDLTSINISNDGMVMASYSNGVTRAEAQVALANFRNPQGLLAVGGNNWVESFDSGPAVMGTPGDGNFGALRSGALEDSNVDLTAELVNMMTAQRAYQANAQTIKTQDQVMSTLVNLR
ncbi:hypothetical protein C380_20930 [Acidovorax sp. KKS102]|uniref:flagellar hook protein FlgE n=1 Tax=Acidovorax sp. KKS102 TaxID=358220 RepID=UPI00028A54D5|nr:flagellar hook-basal body complex protein [Acidovorax sp. KKS102]AFU47878.1 hypothetical protein C380_20930 [Acidovorax sp. KKS102]